MYSPYSLVHAPGQTPFVVHEDCRAADEAYTITLGSSTPLGVDE